MTEILDAISKILRILIDSPDTAILSGVGLLLLGMAAYYAHRTIGSKPEETTTFTKVTLFVALIFGMLFSAAGPSLALYRASDNGLNIRTTSPEKAFSNLEQNAEVKYLVRLIAYHPVAGSRLSIDRLQKLGHDKQQYTFVADYHELIGRTAVQALQLTGGSFEAGQHISAIIFRRPTSIYPANARGLLQVIGMVEAKRELDLPRRFLETNTLNLTEVEDLKITSIPSYKVERFSDKYRHYCELANRYRCGDYSAKDYIGEVSDDWHPLGFSKKIRSDHCPMQISCAFNDWKSERERQVSNFGSRAFLISNLEINAIPGRILVHFDKPEHQVIPHIGIH